MLTQTVSQSHSVVSFSDWMNQVLSEVEAALNAVLPTADMLPTRLHDAMRYTVLAGGKRVRPLLVAAAGQLVQAVNQSILDAACAVELIHCYSLVHDDMPCMDDDVLRRGRPTVHVQYDEPTALLVGDALQTLAFDILANSHTIPHALKAVAVLAKASGSQGMAGGQAIDLESVGKVLDRTELETMHRKKTGALISAAVELGYLCGAAIQPSVLKQLHTYSSAIGLAFQVVDDVLDATSTTAVLGKTSGKDQANDKPTYVSLLGLESAKQLIKQLHHTAQEALLPFGDKALRLRQLADFIIGRSY